jgi:predicted O-methyltransferase YrrM
MEYLPTVGSIEQFLAGLGKAAEFTPPGAFIEVGIYTGGSASVLTEIAQRQNRQIFLYDTFEGLPYSSHGDTHQVGEFCYADYEHIKNSLPYATVTRGIFPESAVDMPDIAFAHLDVDQYESYVGCINYLKPRMVPGGIMWFDDYELPGAKQAIDELIGAEKLEWFHYPDFNSKVFTRF